MDKIDIKKLKRNPNIIKSKINIQPNHWIAKDTLYILFPSKYVDKELAILDTISSILGVFIIMDPSYNYSVSTIPGKIDTTPDEINEVEINEEPYYQLTFLKDDTIIDNTNIINDVDIPYKMFEFFILQGKVPFFINEIDLNNIFKNIPTYTGTKVGTNSLPNEVCISLIARDKKDPLKEFRNIVKDPYKEIPRWVGLQNPYYSFKSVISKITGAYFKDGVLSALVTDPNEVTDVEKALRA